MTTNRRTFLAASGAAITLLPFSFGTARAAGHSGDVFSTPAGDITITPVNHASFVITGPQTIYVDPVGDASLYAGLPAPDAIIITHEHGDHYNAETLAAIDTANAPMIANGAVFDMLTDDQKARTTSMANGDSGTILDLPIEAIPAYNITEGRENFHPQGRDNGYVLDLGGFRIYVSGDTEDTPELRSLENIDIAFVCMNLPFTMDAEAAASAVAEFAPTYVYPYHYRGRDNGTQDPMEFANMLPDGIEAKMGGWYA